MTFYHGFICLKILKWYQTNSQPVPSLLSPQKHNPMATSNVTSASELIKSFSKVVNSLNEDVTRLSGLSEIRNQLLFVASSDTPNTDSENSDPNSTSAAPSTIEYLKALNATLTDLEKRAEMLEMVVEDEKSASKEIEKNRDVALEQKALLALIMPHLPAKLPGDALSDGSKPSTSSSAPPRSIPVSASNISDDSSSIADNDTVSVMSAPSVNTLRNAPKIEILMEEELMSVQRSIRSRVTLTALNDAVVDINDVAANKYKALSQASGKGRKTKKFQQLIIHHRETVVPEHEGRFFVSEQDLRDCCAFFRGGESTARAVLNILRSTKRLKQIQGGGAVVTYCFL